MTTETPAPATAPTPGPSPSATATAAATIPRPGAPAPVPFLATVASEWTKLASLRATWWTVGLGAVLGVAMTALLAMITGATFDQWPAAQRAAFEPVSTALFGSLFTTILLVVLGVRAVSGEYSSGMMRLTLAATPRRARLLLAKVAVVTAVTLVAGTVATVAQHLAGQAIFAAFDLPTASLGEGGAPRAVAAVSVMSPVWPLIGAALAVLLRGTTGAVTSVLALVFAPAIFGPLLPRWWQENVLSLLPGPASDSIALGHLAPSPMYLGTGAAAAAVAAWLVVFVGAAAISLTRRDA